MKVLIVGTGSDLEIAKKLIEHLGKNDIPYQFIEENNHPTIEKPDLEKLIKPMAHFPKKGSKYHK